MAAQSTAPPITPRLKARCREFVFIAAKQYGVPPAYVVAHVRGKAVDEARRWVMCRMLTTLRMKRWQVAMAFGRDVRRIRKSVIGA